MEGLLVIRRWPWIWTCDKSRKPPSQPTDDGALEIEGRSARSKVALAISSNSGRFNRLLAPRTEPTAGAKVSMPVSSTMRRLSSTEWLTGLTLDRAGKEARDKIFLHESV